MSQGQLAQRRSSPRLAGFNYTGSYAYFITCCTYQKKSCFQHKATVDTVLAILKETSEKLGFSIYAYCFMPDHLHLLLLGEEEDYLGRFIKLFKQRSGFVFKKEHGDSLWQRSYYDHVLRQEEALREMALYIFQNPVRKGLVANYRDYPFLGSFVFDCNTMWEQFSPCIF